MSPRPYFRLHRASEHAGGLHNDGLCSWIWRRGVWSQTATSVALVTSTAGDARNVTACEWAVMTSGGPLRFIISIGPHSATHEPIEQSGEFGLSFLLRRAAITLARLRAYSLHDIDKWELADLPRYPAATIAAPMIAGCAP